MAKPGNEEKGVYETEVYLLEEGRSSEEAENLQEENMDIQEENQGE